MKNLILPLAFTTALLLQSFSAHSAFEKGEDILWACNMEDVDSKGFEEMLSAAGCMWYVAGILDGAQLVFGLKPEAKLFCAPESGISVDQQIRIVRKHLEGNPEELHESARMSVFLAFQLAFPCK